MKPAQRKTLIRRIDDDVARIQARLVSCHAQLQEIEARFKAERRDVLREARRVTKRPQVTHLILKVILRERRVLNVPIAEWRHILSRGNRVARAHETLSRKTASRQVKMTKGQTGVFSKTIPMNRKCGWRVNDLRAYWHPDEAELVKETEAAMQPIRLRIASLTTTATKLLQSRYQHAKMLDAAPAIDLNLKVKPRKKTPSWALAEDQLELSLESPAGPDTADRPQLRNPDG
ncbi:hypothetical protein [Rhodanobacter sp. FW106-PBR-R2A-1-13]|uniref:hypothetical protein n=1 Tax=Rhodanobacter sp. FW106-PBR-R2A-1-13 TaxID=3454845 RepID=UPI0034E47872